jgi:chemotaxis protein MotC
MMRPRNRQSMMRLFFAGALFAGAGPALGSDDLEPYKMMRSLQFIQDAVVLGDHSAGEMQRFLLKTLDQRLRTAGPETFRDTRNVDAVFIFTMSGGNPQTLEYLASRDIEGEFDGRLSRVLRRYLQGQGISALPSFEELVKEYGNTAVGPYLALVAGNVSAGTEAQKALEYFDKVRLLAPGTNLEEAALRRSLAIALQISDFPKAMDLSGRYVRRFLYSPYASQFVDMFVQLVVDGDGKIQQNQWTDVVATMDDERAQEFYLRVARRALLAGKKDLARDAASFADQRAVGPAKADDVVGQLYGHLAEISTPKVTDAAKSLSQIPDAALSDRDRNLRDAARNIAEQILMPPAAAVPLAVSMPVDGKTEPAAAPIAQPISASGQQVADKHSDFQSYVDENRSKLKQIDDLLEEEAQ